MSCLGVLFALNDDQTNRLLASARLGDAALDDFVEEIEEAEDAASQGQMPVVSVDKSWDAMHRCLSDGTTNFDGGAYPLNRAILGGKQLHEGEDYIVAFVPKNEVVDVAKALLGVTESWFRERFFALRGTDFPQGYIDEQFWEYTWDNFIDVQAFYQRAAQMDGAVIFTVDQ